MENRKEKEKENPAQLPSSPLGPPAALASTPSPRSASARASPTPAAWPTCSGRQPRPASTSRGRTHSARTILCDPTCLGHGPRVHLPETARPHALPFLSPHARCPLSPTHGPHPSVAPPSLSFLLTAQRCARYHRRVRRDPYPAAPRDPRRSPFNWPQRTPLHPHLHALAASNPSRSLRLAPPCRLLCATADQPRHSLPAPANHPRSPAPTSGTPPKPPALTPVRASPESNLDAISGELIRRGNWPQSVPLRPS